MATETTTLTLPLSHLYYLTADSNNDTGYTLEEVLALIQEHGNDYRIQVSITHPVPEPWTTDLEIEQYQQRISNDEQTISSLREQLATFAEGSSDYDQVQQQIQMLESDIVMCNDHIQSLQNS